MEKQSDFRQVYLLVQHMRIHMTRTEKYKKESNLSKSIYLATMGIYDPPKN